MATRMQQSLDELEQAFVEETHEDRARADMLRRRAAIRTQKRRLDQVHKRGTARFVLLVSTLLLTATIVTIVMFRVLYIVMG